MDKNNTVYEMGSYLKNKHTNIIYEYISDYIGKTDIFCILVLKYCPENQNQGLETIWVRKKDISKYYELDNTAQILYGGKV